MSGTINTPSTTPTERMIVAGDLDAVITRLQSLLARVSSGEVVASPGFEQRLFGGLVALEAVAAGAPLDVKTLVQTWSER